MNAKLTLQTNTTRLDMIEHEAYVVYRKRGREYRRRLRTSSFTLPPDAEFLYVAMTNPKGQVLRALADER